MHGHGRTIVRGQLAVSTQPDGLNVPVHAQIESVIVNGEDWTEQLDGYLDIGLIDTMKDLQVNCIGAIAFSIIGFFYVKARQGQAGGSAHSGRARSRKRKK